MTGQNLTHVQQVVVVVHKRALVHAPILPQNMVVKDVLVY